MNREIELKNNSQSNPDQKSDTNYLLPVEIYKDGVDTGKRDFIDLRDPNELKKLQESLRLQDGEFD